MFCISSQSHGFLIHSCTHDVLVALILHMSTISTRHARSLHVQGLRQASAPLFFSCCFGLDSEPLWKCFRSLRWNLCLRQVILALIRIPHVVSPCKKHISSSTLAAYDFDVTSGGGTGGSWWTVLTRVYCGMYCVVNEQLVYRKTGQRRKILKRGSGATSGVPPMSKQHSNLNDDGCSDGS